MNDGVLTFVVPVRHGRNSTDWHELKRRLAQTIRSISGVPFAPTEELETAKLRDY
jgi:hypothetical protein